mgnify:CR=1 FL=1
MPKVKLSESEINSFADDISKVLMDIPLFYIYEVLELANEIRQREGELEDLDISDSDEEQQSANETESSDEENNSDIDK